MKRKIAIWDGSSKFSYLSIFDRSQLSKRCFHDNRQFHILVCEIAFYAPLLLREVVF